MTHVPDPYTIKRAIDNHNKQSDIPSPYEIHQAAQKHVEQSSAIRETNTGISTDFRKKD